MKKSSTYKLDNGLQLVFYQDTSMHSVMANIYIKFGGINKKFIYDNKEYNIEKGIAHFLEHTLIDNGYEGNMYNAFTRDNVQFNGVTSRTYTKFFIDTVHDFDEYLEKLIKMVNVPCFTAESVEETKKPILEEIKKNKDNKFRNFDEVATKSIFHSDDFIINIGELEEIENLKYETVKLVYDAFYQPSNQLIAISGNFDVDRTIELIERVYEEVKREYKHVEIPNFNEPLTVCRDYGEIIQDVSDNYLELSFKIDISHLTPYENVKLSFYMNYFLSYNFNESSDAYKYMMDHKMTNYNINYSDFVTDKFLVVSIGSYTDNVEEFKNLILDKINNKCFDEEDFELRKNTTIINLILREEKHPNVLLPFVDNILSFGYEDMDKVSDIEEYTFDDYVSLISNLDFSNYTVNRMLKEEQ